MTHLNLRIHYDTRNLSFNYCGAFTWLLVEVSSMSAWHGGKGSAPRKGADRKAYEDNWEKIFGKKEKTPVEQLEELNKIIPKKP